MVNEVSCMGSNVDASLYDGAFWSLWDGNFKIHIWAGFGYSIYSGILTVYTSTSGVLTIKEHIKKVVCFLSSVETF